MQKRSEAARQEKVFFRTKLRHTVIMVLCILFALSTVYAVDISTYKLVENDKDQYAMRITSPDERTLRIDFVGRRYDLDVYHVKMNTVKLMNKARSLVNGLAEKIK